jgi:hypothetical protein
MAEKKCYVCGKSPLSKDEIGLTKKLIDKKKPAGFDSGRFFVVLVLYRIEVNDHTHIGQLSDLRDLGSVYVYQNQQVAVRKALDGFQIFVVVHIDVVQMLQTA